MRRQDFNYSLPNELIARYPADQRATSRMLVLPTHGGIRDLGFQALPGLLKAGDMLVFNDSKVIPARAFGRKPTGGKVEILLERALDHRRA
ncbi:MAG: S-adenosylmethionine:tRNA ribosyltransferase-isomerase, partial [Gammaproteobacteria bacterium]|nr:S-adenosylmethionine:tRNA ribosyltransferase-isomerase [Gammaproteobacteria bacterium]